jgi:hypothetical protein
METVKQHDDPVIYSARGTICGIYRPSSENFLQGTLLTDDGLKIPAQLTDDVATILKANRDLLKVAQVWKCYPRTKPPFVVLVKLKTQAKTVQELKRKGVNKFRVVGQVEDVDNKKVRVLIKRNELPPEGVESAFTLTLRGSFPLGAIGQFWKFNVRREGWNLKITTATLLANAPPTPPNQKKVKRSLSVKVTEKEYRAVVAYAEKYGKSKSQVVRALIRKLPTYKPDR